MIDIQRELMTEASRLGMAARVVSVQRLPDLSLDIIGPRDAGLLDQGVVQIGLSFFEFTPPSELPGATHIVILAHPEPVSVAELAWGGSLREVIIPPTYQSERARKDLQALRSLVEDYGYRIARARLPLKALAVHSGLGYYGRNNICYVPGMGSFVRLDAFYTDAPLSEDGWGEKTLMEACHHCSACEVNCPTGSIGADRFIIRAEKCLTYLNELDGDFPDWVQPRWHNALIGCMRCQTACPENVVVVENKVMGERFTEPETNAVLSVTALDQLPSELRAKLARLEWGVENHTYMQRNLKALLGSSK